MGLWFALVIVLAAWLLLYIFGYNRAYQGNSQVSGILFLFRIAEVVVVVLKPALDMLVLYMFVAFSKPLPIRMFDKVCKKKFLLYLQGI